MHVVESLLGTEVEDRAALAPQPQRRRRRGPEPVPARRLDLDHVRAKVGQDHRGHATDRSCRDVDDAEPLEDGGH